MREYGFSLTCILPYKDRIYNYVLIREKTGQWKPVFSHILYSNKLYIFHTHSCVIIIIISLISPLLELIDGKFWINTTQKMKFSIQNIFCKFDHLQETADLVTLTEEILIGKLHFLCCEMDVRYFIIISTLSDWLCVCKLNVEQVEVLSFDKSAPPQSFISYISTTQCTVTVQKF